MDEVNVQVEVKANPTEDLDKVRQAVENIFGNLKLEEKPQHKGSLLVAQAKDTESLVKFGNLLRRERIRDAARGILFQSLRGNTITFHLNKQVAYAGHISFCEPVAESPLGPIRVQIKCNNPTKLIDWLAPRTM
ncbi:MAG: RNA-binding domain-containing protein [Candidatus Bathyarchaeia archaeon]